jgi:two-component system phosphate regulon sensor histidine kinase PhoR
MKKRDTVLLLGIFSIAILIIAQVIIIRGVWRQNYEMLDLRYRSLSQEAVATLRGQRSFDVYDTVRFILDRYSEKVVKELPELKDEKELAQKKKEILEYFTLVLNEEQDLSSYLSAYFERMGVDKNFNHSIEISNLEIIGADTFRIYQNEFFRRRRVPLQPGIIPAPTDTKSTKILVYRNRLEDNYYSLFFEYYIDFADKRKLVLQASSASLAMSIFSMLVVVTIFLVTYRNLMEERRLSNLKTDFINNMTHELKTPLATITVAGKTLEMEKIRRDDAKILETAKLIGKQSVHLNQLINMILEISMWERTQFQLDRKKVDIEEIMNDIVASFKSGSGNEASLLQKYTFNGVKADIDLIYFTTMINNLLSNAVKYNDKDPVINVEGFTDERNICIKVADNGMGISKTDQKHIFDKFYRASSGNIHKFKGLGLGLYYVKKIAVAHGGDVTVSSKPGKGSIFTVTIPY